MADDNLGLGDGAATAVQQVISNFHTQAHDSVVNIRNTVTGVVDSGEYAGAGANATVDTMGRLQNFWDRNLEPILTDLYDKVGGMGEALAAQDNQGAAKQGAIEAGSGMTAKGGRL